MRHRSLPGEASDYLKAVAQASRYPASVCWRCHLRPGPHKCPARGRWLVRVVPWVLPAGCVMAVAAFVLGVAAPHLAPDAGLGLSLAGVTLMIAAWPRQRGRKP